MKTLILKDCSEVFEYICIPAMWNEDEKRFVEYWGDPIWRDEKGERILESALLWNISDWMRSE